MGTLLKPYFLSKFSKVCRNSKRSESQLVSVGGEHGPRDQADFVARSMSSGSMMVSGADEMEERKVRVSSDAERMRR